MRSVKPEFLTNDLNRETDTVASQLGTYLAWLLRNRAEDFDLAAP